MVSYGLASTEDFIRYVFDGDLDGYGIDEDCDDDNPNVLIDCDLDGLDRDEDCDDSNPSIGADFSDCDGDGLPATEDCDDTDADETSGDCDGDGVQYQVDCDDFDAGIGATGYTGISAPCAGHSCLDILETGYADGSKNYWIDNNAEEPLEVYCDMKTEDGGWMLAGVLDAPALNLDGVLPFGQINLVIGEVGYSLDIDALDDGSDAPLML